MQDTFGACEQFHTWDPQLLHRFGDTILQKIPAGSIYLCLSPGGGTCSVQSDGGAAVRGLSDSESENERRQSARGDHIED